MRVLRLAVPASVTLLVALAVTGLLTPETVKGLASTPSLTLLLVPLARAAMFVTGAAAVGGVLIGGVLGDEPRALRIGMRSAFTYAGVSAFVALMTLADVLAAQPWQALNPNMLLSFVTQIDEGRYFLLQLVLGCSTGLMLMRIRHRIDTSFALLLMLVAVALPGFSGHSAAATTHWLASTTMIAHLVAMNLWVGGVLLLLVVEQHATLRSFSALALSCYIVVLLSGVANVVTRVGDWSALWGNPYALVLGAKVVLLLVLGALGARQRTRVVAAATDDTVAGSVARVLAIEVTVMLTAIALAVVLARMANP